MMLGIHELSNGFGGVFAADTAQKNAQGKARQK
jgi:hypothetical protein